MNGRQNIVIKIDGILIYTDIALALVLVGAVITTVAITTRPIVPAPIRLASTAALGSALAFICRSVS